LSDTVTRGIRIEVRSEYDALRSAPKDDHYFFAYHVRISNLGTEAAQLLSRLWIITDADGDVERVEGPGVVGETPVLEPGDAFEYTSFCPLTTPVGTMEGHYVMVLLASGERFDAEIGRFTLAAPGAVN
jgi:ApaG protein